jgi:hypothetical protein
MTSSAARPSDLRPSRAGHPHHAPAHRRPRRCAAAPAAHLRGRCAAASSCCVPVTACRAELAAGLRAHTWRRRAAAWRAMRTERGGVGTSPGCARFCALRSRPPCGVPRCVPHPRAGACVWPAPAGVAGLQRGPHPRVARGASSNSLAPAPPCDLQTHPLPTALQCARRTSTRARRVTRRQAPGARQRRGSSSAASACSKYRARCLGRERAAARSNCGRPAR